MLKTKTNQEAHEPHLSPEKKNTGEEDLSTCIVNAFLLFHNYMYLPLGNGVALYLNKFESHSPKDALCQVWLKLAPWFCRRRFLNFLNVFSLYHNHLFKKAVALHLNKLASNSPKDSLYQVRLKLAQWFWRRRWKYEKLMDRQTAGDQKSLLELSTQVS